MKKFSNLFIFVLIAFVALTVKVNAATNDVKLTCENSSIAVGGSTTCTILGTYNDSTTSLKSFSTIINTSQYLSISKVTANTNIGFSNITNNGTTYTATYDSTNGKMVVGTEFEIMSFTVTLLDSAKNLGENDSCGNLCLSTALFNDTVVDKSSVGDGICYSPTVTITSSNPTTGNFMNYALLGGAALLTIGAISLVSRKNKFYHV